MTALASLLSIQYACFECTGWKLVADKLHLSCFRIKTERISCGCLATKCFSYCTWRQAQCFKKWHLACSVGPACWGWWWVQHLTEILCRPCIVMAFGLLGLWLLSQHLLCTCADKTMRSFGFWHTLCMHYRYCRSCLIPDFSIQLTTLQRDNTAYRDLPHSGHLSVMCQYWFAARHASLGCSWTFL